MRGRGGLLLLLGSALAALALSLSCGGGGGKHGQTILVIDQNLLHGILNEDPQAEPFDRFKERIQVTADRLGEAKPDIITLQEVNEAGKGDPAYGDVRAVLLAALGPEYTALFGDIVGSPMDTGSLGQMTLTRLPIVSSENHHIGGVRSVHRVTVRAEDGTLIDIYNAHLEGTGAIIDVTQDQSVVEINNVIDFIKTTRSGTGPVILDGDLNALPDDPSIQRLLDEGFIDVLATGGDATCDQAGDPGCTNSALPLGDNPTNTADHRIDYIWTLPGTDASFAIKSAALFGNTPADIGGGHTLWASDHIGVQATLELKQED